jgi:hypothetical protein
MQTLAIAIAASFFTFSGSVALADTGCTKLKGLSGAYCPVKAKRNQTESLLAQGCVQIARDGVILATPYCPIAMFEVVVVEASMAPVRGNTASDNSPSDGDSDKGDVGGDTGGSTGGDKEAGDTSSDGGAAGGGSEGSGTGSDSGSSGESSEAGDTGSDSGSSGGSSEASGTSSQAASGPSGT